MSNCCDDLFGHVMVQFQVCVFVGEVFQSFSDVVFPVSDHYGRAFVSSVDDEIVISGELFECDSFSSG